MPPANTVSNTLGADMAQETTPAAVAQAATEQAAGNLSGLILLGTFGSDTKPRALVRTSGGDVVELKVGDRIGKSPIIAIETGRLAFAQNGATKWLAQPVTN